MIEVIGLGMGRTGTLSLKLALEQLDFGPCYHMETLLNQPEDVSYWKAIDRQGSTNWNALLRDFRSIVDFPVIAYYESFLEAFPDAKCVLTLRDPESWYESVSKTIFTAEPGPVDKVRMSLKMPFSRRLRNLIQVFQLTEKFWVQQGGKNYRNKAQAIRMMEAWNNKIRARVPADRLLEYPVAEGWEPLCTFLKVPVPNTPFPRANSRTEFSQKNKQLFSR